MGAEQNADNRREFRDGEDPTKMANQPALRTSSGAIWLGIGALLVVICLIVLIPLIPLGNPAPLFGAVLIVLLYAAMIVVRFAVHRPVARLRALAALFGLIALIGLLAVLISAYAGTP
ncbi:hypothetical protein [Paramicrobacterium chengjingii]|uniref:Uncharacterized protein n=1 Tax=Paramicrobacterium chengjingii TaxID=2769067 RepID=A0ABX6YHV2_9MICO|nr:hypothetical protein [Microbacterium chengjingii]QPZ38378.1 hypothetical protein HCR76_16600 [Microbacterium chengjingii]